MMSRILMLRLSLLCASVEKLLHPRYLDDDTVQRI